MLKTFPAVVTEPYFPSCCLLIRVFQSSISIRAIVVILKFPQYGVIIDLGGYQ